MLFQQSEFMIFELLSIIGIRDDYVSRRKTTTQRSNNDYHAAIERIDCTKFVLSEFAAEWISIYRKWRDQGLHHEIGKGTDGLVARQAEPDEMGWYEFLADHTGEWDISYCTGTDNMWVTWVDEYMEKWYSLCRQFIANQIATMLGIVDEQAVADLADNEDVSVRACECDEPDLVELILEAVMAACGFDGTELPANSGCR